MSSQATSPIWDGKPRASICVTEEVAVTETQAPDSGRFQLWRESGSRLLKHMCCVLLQAW